MPWQRKFAAVGGSAILVIGIAAFTRTPAATTGLLPSPPGYGAPPTEIAGTVERFPPAP